MCYVLILWHPMILYFDEATNLLKERDRINVIKFFDFTIKDNVLLEFIYKIYEKDIGFKKNQKDGVFDKKCDLLKNKGEIIRIIIIQIENPKLGIKKLICKDVVNLKHKFRNIYKKHTKDWTNIIHGCDSEEYSNYVINFLSKYEDNIYK
uniref:Uncharacterized protein n=1 Tax=viral metagenome TaxID=1070528 RepID=A0A6C0L343_9ZZZZ|tara:strand:+ start:9774 stop:10223 length:450 start_codon:yes stop_codon:yes gene_type:complete